MVRKYEKTPGSRNYKNYSNEKLNQALDAIQQGMSKKRAAILFKIPRASLINKCRGRHYRSVGHPSVLSSEEQRMIVDTLGQVAKWGFPLTKIDIRALVKKYLDKQGKTVSVFKDNYPGPDFVDNLIKKNNLSARMATNIKKSRSSVDKDDIIEFFDNMKEVLGDIDEKCIYNYDETNIADDPGAKKVIVPRNCRRVERVQNYSRSCVSIMVCGNAAGDLLPPMVVYKSANLYENWCLGAPTGTIFGNSLSGWFDMNLFEQWFFKILLPHIKERQEPGKRYIVIGDNLASHFSPRVIKAAVENNIYMCPFPANATHLMQPLDVAVFAPIKRKWRDILDKWRRESRYSGTLPKEHFPTLLSTLWNNIADTVKNNLKSGFRTCGLCPMNANEVLKKIPGALPEDVAETVRVLDTSLVELFQEMRGTSVEQKKRKRGKKFVPGKQLTAVEDSDLNENAQLTGDRLSPEVISDTDFSCATESATNSSKSLSKKSTKIPTKTRPSNITTDITTKSLSVTDDDNTNCGICSIKYKNYKAQHEWIECLKCRKWICGICNQGSTEPFFVCSTCYNSSSGTLDTDSNIDDSQGPSGISSKILHKRSTKNMQPLNITKKSLRGTDEANTKCGICYMKFKNYRDKHEWIECLKCHKWICGICNEGSKEPFFVCSICDDSDDDAHDVFSDIDDSDNDETFTPNMENKNKIMRKLKY